MTNSRCELCRFGKLKPVLDAAQVKEPELVCTKPDFSRAFHLENGMLICDSIDLMTKEEYLESMGIQNSSQEVIP